MVRKLPKNQIALNSCFLYYLSVYVNLFKELFLLTLSSSNRNPFCLRSRCFSKAFAKV